MTNIPRSKKRPWIKRVERKPIPWNANPEHREIYWSTEWRRLREDILTENPFCKCGKPAEVVDHILPVRKGGDIWDEKNLQAMCKRCHNSKTAKESNQ